MALSMAPFIQIKQALTYNDDTILQAQNEAGVFEIILKNHSLVRTAGVKVSPEKNFFISQEVKFLGDIVSNIGTQPIAKRIQDSKNLETLENKREVMRVIGSFGWYSHYAQNLRVNCKPLYKLEHFNIPFHWTNENEQIFQQIKEDLSRQTILAILGVQYPFRIHVDSSNVGTDSILVQEFPEGKRDLSFNSRTFGKTEQKPSTMDRELVWNCICSRNVSAQYDRLFSSNLCLL